jgi:hypothetical protein
MNKQEYIEKHNQLSQQMKELEESYINANAPYPVGTRVKVTGSNGKTRIGIVKGSTISSFNKDVVPILKQETNDGKESMRSIVVYMGDKIEVL